jgi:hypothetical protein
VDEVIDEKAKQLCTDVLREIMTFFCASIIQYENIREKGFVRSKSIIQVVKYKS